MKGWTDQSIGTEEKFDRLCCKEKQGMTANGPKSLGETRLYDATRILKTTDSYPFDIVKMVNFVFY